MTTAAALGGDRIFDSTRLEGLHRFVLIALTFLLPISMVTRVGGKLINFSYADAILPLAGLLLAWRLITRVGLRFPVPMLFFFSAGVICLSTCLNLERALVFKGAVSQVVEFLKLMSLWAYFYTMVNLLDRREDMRLMLKTWILSSGVVATLGIVGSLLFQYARIETVFSLQFRAQGTFDDANLFAAHCGLSLMLGILYMKLTGARWPITFLVLQFGGILFSASRGSLISVIAALGMLGFVFAPMKARLAVAFGLFMTILGLLAFTDTKELLASNPITRRLNTATVDLDDPEAQQRKGLWEVAFRTWQNNPWFGTGKGNYGMGEPGDAGAIGVAHSTYLGLLAETGMIGFLAYLIAGGSLIAPSLVQALKGDLAAAVLLAALVVIMLAGVTISIENYRGLWALMAFFEAYRRIYVDPLTPRDRRVSRAS